MKGRVTCPGCKLNFEAEVKKHEGGAGYALEQTALTQTQMKVMSWWFSSPWAEIPLTKKDIIVRSNFASGTVHGRVSEFVALGIVNKQVTNVKGRRALFVLNRDRVIKLLNNGGKLKNEGYQAKSITTLAPGLPPVNIDNAHLGTGQMNMREFANDLQSTNK